MNRLTIMVEVESADLASFSPVFFNKCLSNTMNSEFNILSIVSELETIEEQDKDSVKIKIETQYNSETKLEPDFLDRVARREFSDAIKYIFKNYLHSLIFKIIHFEVIPNFNTTYK